MYPFVTSKTGYMESAFEQPSELAARMRTALAGVKYDTLVGTGLSGALVIPSLARCLRKRWLIVRKNDGTHSSRIAEGELGKQWVFVDDLIDTGSTRARVRRAVNALASDWGGGFVTAEVGTYLYGRNHFTKVTDPGYRAYFEPTA